MSLAPLMGIPGRLKVLIDRLTSARASNLDNLNATVSSRAPASTALTSATWTNARAAYLDNLNGLVASRLDVAVSTIGDPALTRHAEVEATYTGVTSTAPLVISLGASFDEGKTLIQLTAYDTNFSGLPARAHIVWCWQSASTIAVQQYDIATQALIAGNANARVKVTALEFSQ